QVLHDQVLHDQLLTASAAMSVSRSLGPDRRQTPAWLTNQKKKTFRHRKRSSLTHAARDRPPTARISCRASRCSPPRSICCTGGRRCAIVWWSSSTSFPPPPSGRSPKPG